jgi:hypothetical protein
VSSILVSATQTDDPDPLLLILDYEVIPVAKSKQARGGSSGQEASGIVTVLRQWPVLALYVSYPSVRIPCSGSS